MKQIRNTRQLRQALARGHHDFALLLQWGLYSSKVIHALPRGRFVIFNFIDDSEQRLTARQLYSESNIGKAMRLGAFVVSP